MRRFEVLLMVADAGCRSPSAGQPVHRTELGEVWSAGGRHRGARDRGQVRESLQQRIQAATLEREGGNLVLAVVLPETDTVIGDVVLFWTSREHRQGEIGYIFHPDQGGKGYAMEATQVMLRLGFRRTRATPHHRASQRAQQRIRASS